MRANIFIFLFASLAFSSTAFAQNTPTVIWEVANRFAPFETQESPNTLFEAYALQDNESFAQWHERLAQNQVHSPYRAALQLRENFTRHIHWNQNTQTHAQQILDFVQKEKAPNTTISVNVRLDTAVPCTWSFTEASTPDCSVPVTTRVPLGTMTPVTARVGDTDVPGEITPEHIVIVAMGDSYGSGEGNPDNPVGWNKDQFYWGKRTFNWVVDYPNRLAGEPEKFGTPQKRWVDDTCHRSFFSHQSLTALRMASENKKSFVSFLHYACTGAEIFDGILVPQYQAWGKGIYVNYSQLNFAIRDLCVGQIGDYEALSDIDLKGLGEGFDISAFDRRGSKDNLLATGSELIPYTDPFAQLVSEERRNNNGAYPNSGILKCEGEIRKPDYLFLSIGGNDVGFADIIAYYLVPTEWDVDSLGNILFPDVCPNRRYRVGPGYPALYEHCDDLWTKLGYDIKTLIGPNPEGSPKEHTGLQERYQMLFAILSNRLKIAPHQIVMPQYPDPLRTQPPTAGACSPLTAADKAVFGSPAGVYAPTSPWNALKASGPVLAGVFLDWNMRGWQMNLTEWDASQALSQADDFRVQVAEVAKSAGITFVCETRDAYIGYGWWQGDRLNLPHTKPKWELATWDPYIFEESTRAIRTGNDSMITQPGDKRQTGTFHPNLTGHRLIAEEVFKKIREEETAN